MLFTIFYTALDNTEKQKKEIRSFGGKRKNVNISKMITLYVSVGLSTYS